MTVRKTRRWTLLIPVIAHTLLTLLVFLPAMLKPIRSGLLPIVVFVVDLPFSFVIKFLADSVVHDGIGYYPRLLNDMSWFLVLGGAWWYGIGCGVVFLIDQTRSLAAKRTM